MISNPSSCGTPWLLQTLCVNEDVAKLQSGARINEKCLDLQQRTTKRQAAPPLESQTTLGRQVRSPCCFSLASHECSYDIYPLCKPRKSLLSSKLGDM